MVQALTTMPRAHLCFNQGFPEVVRHGETIKLFTGTADPEELESFLSQKMPRPEVCQSDTG